MYIYVHSLPSIDSPFQNQLVTDFLHVFPYLFLVCGAAEKIGGVIGGHEFSAPVWHELAPDSPYRLAIAEKRGCRNATECADNPGLHNLKLRKDIRKTTGYLIR